jgi:ketopantoate reductase
MRTLILDAGVIGSFNAARLTDAGQDITLLARGRRLEDLREHGVVLEDFQNGRRTITQVQLVDRLKTVWSEEKVGQEWAILGCTGANGRPSRVLR